MLKFYVFSSFIISIAPIYRSVHRNNGAAILFFLIYYVMLFLYYFLYYFLILFTRFKERYKILSSLLKVFFVRRYFDQNDSCRS